MNVSRWKSEISAVGKRALVLKDLRMDDEGLIVGIEDEAGAVWSLDFRPVQALRITSEECAGNLIAELPTQGAFFVVRESQWIRELGDAGALRRSTHFVLCCYDQVIEVLAWSCSENLVAR